MSDGVLSISAANSFAAEILRTQVEVGVLKKTLEIQQQQGAAAIQLLEAATQATQTVQSAPAPAGVSGSLVNVTA